MQFCRVFLSQFDLGSLFSFLFILFLHMAVCLEEGRKNYKDFMHLDPRDQHTSDSNSRFKTPDSEYQDIIHAKSAWYKLIDLNVTEIQWQTERDGLSACAWFIQVDWPAVRILQRIASTWLCLQSLLHTSPQATSMTPVRTAHTRIRAAKLTTARAPFALMYNSDANRSALPALATCGQEQCWGSFNK